MTFKVRRTVAIEGPVRFTSAEARVLPFLPTQLTIEEIAERVDRRRSTVKTHVAHIYAKLGASKRTEAVERARELGLLRDPGESALLGHPGVAKPARVGRARPDRTVGNRP
jgi:DNA-binding CsgD family transcriptional regulator